MLLRKRIIQEEERDIYEYSIEVLFSDIIYFLVAFFTAVFTSTIFETLIFYVGFFSIRKYSGGYHANTYKVCHLLFWINQLLMILIYKIIPINSSYVFSVVLILISAFFILIFAPISNENRPFTDSERKRFSILSKTIVLLTAAIVIVLGVTNISYKYICIYAFGVFSVSISLVAEKIKKLIKSRKDVTNGKITENH